MPLGWERINVKASQPNKNIVFIKPRPGPQEAISKDYLERIAAQCLPIMNKHRLAVVSLEEYEPNREFWGRNFNNGEVIQLVLRSPSTGHWLPFKFVQMVMMHELAHNKQMNHSKAFWVVRNEFSGEMRALWDRGYTGDGLWGRGVLLENGIFDHETLEEGEALPEHLCGGTFRSRGGNKRKVKAKITYKERQEKRIQKKFGEIGVALGADDEVKAKLEKGKRLVGKPRVAGSARGRELRAAAALARFDVKKEEPQIKDEVLVTDSETESDVEDEVVFKTEHDDAIDFNGVRLLDIKGHGMVRVCEDEDKDDDDARRELEELQGCSARSKLSNLSKSSTPKQEQLRVSDVNTIKQGTAKGSSSTSAEKPGRKPAIPTISEVNGPSRTEKTEGRRTSANNVGDENKRPDTQALGLDGSCPVCSVVNEKTALTCMVCSNVLRPEFVPDSWRCKSSACKDGDYINAGDVRLCGICGTRQEING